MSLQPSLADFHNAFQVVFVDPSGHLNMCADMTACTYKQVDTILKKTYVCSSKMHCFTDGIIQTTEFDPFQLGSQLQAEASVSMQFWDDPTVDGFHSLLMTPKPMIRTSDHMFQYDSILSTNATETNNTQSLSL